MPQCHLSPLEDKAQTQQYPYEWHQQLITYYPPKSEAPPDSKNEPFPKALHSGITAGTLGLDRKIHIFKVQANTHTQTQLRKF